MKKKIITRICVCAILAALYFIFDMISIKAGPFKLSVSGLPIIIVALFYGWLLNKELINDRKYYDYEDVVDWLESQLKTKKAEQIWNEKIYK